MTARKGWLGEFEPELVETVFKLRVELPNGKIVTKDFSVDLEIDYDLLEEQLSETPAMFAFVSSMLSEQKYVCAKFERQIARRRAKIIQNANETAQADGMKLHKYVLDEIVEADDTILEYQSQLMLAQRSLGKLYGLVDSMRMKSEHLRSLAGFKRQEMRNS
jgi:uncharacterized protein (DUF1778 family)